MNEIDLAASVEECKRRCNKVKSVVDQQAEEIEETKRQMKESVNSLNLERGRARHLEAKNGRVQRDINGSELADEGLTGGEQALQQLLDEKDREINGLMSQVDLLMQVWDEDEWIPKNLLKHCKL